MPDEASTRLSYGSGSLDIPPPPRADLEAPTMSSIDPAFTKARGAEIQTTAVFNLPGPLDGTTAGSVSVTVLDRQLVEKYGAGLDGGRERLIAFSNAPQQARDVQLSGIYAIFIPRASVIPGGDLGFEDRVTSMYLWERPDGSMVQVASDVLEVDELHTYAERLAGS